MKNLAKIPNFRGIDYGQYVEVNTGALINAFGRSIVLHTIPEENVRERYGSTVKYFSHINRLEKKGKFILTSSIFPEGEDAKDVCNSILKELCSNPL